MAAGAFGEREGEANRGEEGHGERGAVQGVRGVIRGVAGEAREEAGGG